MDESAEARRQTHLAEFGAWLQGAQSTPEDRKSQPPAEELLAEHHLMGVVLVAMDAEAMRLNHGSELRAEFWADVVDFIGNFVHICHRAKEKEAFYPAVVRSGLITTEQSTALEQAHQTAKELTLGICEGVDSGDWEQVLRLASMYVHFLRRHMMTEEQELVRPFMRKLDPVIHHEIAATFRTIEAKALADRDRRHYLDVVRRLCDAAGVGHGLDRSDN